MKKRFNLTEKLAEELSRSQTVAEDLDEIDGFSESKYKLIGDQLYKAQTFNLGTIEEDEDALDLIEERVLSFVRENFSGKRVYLTMVDVTYAMEDTEKPIIMRAIVNDDKFKVEQQNEVGDLDDLITTIKEHENYFQNDYEMLDLGYSFGNMELDQQLKDLNEGNSLQSPGDTWSAFYLDIISEPDDIDKFLSDEGLNEDEEFHMQLESRDFVKKDDGMIYEVF